MALVRTVTDLQLAHTCAPQQLPKPRTDWARAGLRYERNVARACAQQAQIKHNPWYYFEDANGGGYVSPDIIIELNACLIIAECKLTYKAEAIKKLRQLYVPVVSTALGKLAFPVVITKNLNEHAPEPGFSLADALALSEPLLHWPGHGALDFGNIDAFPASLVVTSPVATFPNLHETPAIIL